VVLKPPEASWREFDLPGLLVVLCLMAVGTIFVTSATISDPVHLGGRQVLWDVIALVALLAGLLIPYNIWLEYSYLLLGGCCALLIYLLVLGEPVSGARSWLQFGLLSFQPSEVAKVAVILCCANFIKGLSDGTAGFRELLVLWAIVALPMGLTLAQPDFGTATVFMPIAATALYATRFSLLKILRWSAVALALLVLVLALGWVTFFKPYQKERLKAFLDPSYDPLGAGYQVNQAKIAVGSGELIGKGLYSGTQNRLSFLPKPHTDFIFGVLSEETGFAGAAIVLALYLTLLGRLLEAARLARDPQGRLIALGVFSMILYHLFVNIGMVLGILPTTGIPLPFLSYGGSSLLANGWAVGLVFNVRMRRYVPE